MKKRAVIWKLLGMRLHLIKMVQEIKRNNRAYYVCTTCKLSYEDISWAEKCETWCRDHNSCSLEVTLHSEEALARRREREHE